MSPADAATIEASRAYATWADAISPEAMRALRLASPSMAAQLAEILRSPEHPCNPRVMEQLLLNVIGNASIPEHYRQALPKAVASILEVTPDALGLVQAVSAWGPRATSVADTLTHSTRGAGFAYELLGTAALITSDSRARDSVTKLGVHLGDRIDFGVKLQARYGIGGDYLLGQPKRSTVEADLLIQRRENHVIAVDFKHTITGKYTGAISSDQLAGIRSAIGTGEIHEFHFVCNGAFGAKAIDAVNDLNDMLRDEGSDATVYLHEYVQHGV